MNVHVESAVGMSTIHPQTNLVAHEAFDLIKWWGAASFVEVSLIDGIEVEALGRDTILPSRPA